MANEATGRESDKFMLRLPDGMRDRIAEAAKANNRSMNAEIVSRLEESLHNPEEDVKFVFQQHDELVELNRRYNELHESYKRQLETLERRRLMQDESLSVRSREAASAAMTVALHGYLSAARAVERKDPIELNTVLRPVIETLDNAINSEDPYSALQEIRNNIVHPPRAKAPAQRRRAIRISKSDDGTGAD